MLDTQKPSGGDDFSGLRPFETPGRYRSPEVIAEIKHLTRLPRSLFWKEITDARAETMAYFIRDFRLQNRNDQVFDLIEILRKKTSHFILRELNKWASVQGVNREQCLEEINERIVTALITIRPGTEGLETVFWQCLKFVTINAAKKYARIASKEFVPEPLDDGDGNNTDPLSERTASSDLTPDKVVQQQEILRYLNTRMGPEQMQAIVELTEGEALNEIAQRLGVDVRTLYNWRKKAEQILKEYFRNQD